AAATADVEADDLCGTRLAGHQHVLDRQPGTAGSARAVHHVAHRVLDHLHVVAVEVHTFEPRPVLVEHEPRHDLVAGGEPCGHYRQLEGVGEHIALADRGVDRVERLPRLS